MSRKAFYWYEFTVLVGGSVIMGLGEQPYGLILGAAMVVLGIVMFCLTIIRARKSPGPVQPEVGRTIRK